MNPQRAFTIAALLTLVIACSGRPTRQEADTLAPIKFSLDEQLKRADLAYREARLSDAEATYRQVLDEHPTLSGIWFRLGNIYLRQSQFEAAVQAYEQSLRFDPEDSRAWYNLSLVRLKQSLETLELAVARLDSEDPGRQRILTLHSQILNRVADPSKGVEP